jgi:hypothetical protein
MPCRIAVDGELATFRAAVVDVDDSPWAYALVAGEAEELRRQLEEDLTDEARRLLASEDVDVTVTWEQGSLLVSALIAGKVVADIGAFFAGVREIRTVFPKRIRDRVTRWLGRDVAVRDDRLEIEPDLLRATAEEAPKADDKTGIPAASLKELSAYAGLSLAVLVLVAALVIGGALLLT